MSFVPLLLDRFDIRADLSEIDVERLIHAPNLTVVQTRRPLSCQSWALLNDRLIKRRPEIQIRIYDQGLSQFDLSILEYLPDVENLELDYLQSVSNFNFVLGLQKLKSISVDIFNLETFEFLESLPQDIEKVSLGKTKSKKPSLKWLSKLKNIRELHIEGQAKDIHAIGDLCKLEKLVLRSVTSCDIRFIRSLPRLWSLEIKLGGISDLSPLAGLANLKYLELWQVRGLSNLSVLGSLTGLQFLFLQSLINVTDLPDMRSLKALRRVYLESMKGLQNLDGLAKAPVLEEFIHLCALNFDPEHYESLIGMPSLRRGFFGVSNEKKNKRVEALMKEHGVEQYKHEVFQFR